MQQLACAACRKAARDMNKLGKADRAQQAIQRQIFAEGNQVNLVISSGDDAAAFNDLYGVMKARITLAGNPLAKPRRAGDQPDAGWQGRANLRESAGVLREDEGESRLGPDDIRP